MLLSSHLILPEALVVVLLSLTSALLNTTTNEKDIRWWREQLRLQAATLDPHLDLLASCDLRTPTSIDL